MIVGWRVTVLNLLVLLLLDIITNLVFRRSPRELFSLSNECLFELFNLFIVCYNLAFNLGDDLNRLLVLWVDVLLAATDHRSVTICRGSGQFWSGLQFTWQTLKVVFFRLFDCLLLL